jgi:NAD(P)-dependent dehydrogenase (short-subunit alcohol dehydrogenase family)
MTEPGHVALVTGGGRGIGRATATLLAERGLTVVAVARTQPDLADLAAATGADYIVAAVDSEDACAAIVTDTIARHGRIDVLVSNAGLDEGNEREIWLQDPALWRRSMAVNLDAAFHLTRLATAGMVQRRFGRVVMVGSTSGLVGAPRFTAYTAAKHGLLGLMKSVAFDLAPFNATCNAVCPGWVRTPMSEQTARREAQARGVEPAQVWREREAASPAGRVATPQEVASVIAYLASVEASGVNGAAVTVTVGAAW